MTVALLTTGCSASDSPSRTAPAPAPAPAAEASLEHIHGMGVDPADGGLYAATHTGVYVVPASGEPQRVADRHMDTMGFLIVGPNQFLASGHPDLREGLPTRLGLIESTDGTQTWRSLSLAGAADFHALRVAGPWTYGFDSVSGRILASQDRASWESRAALDLLDFVVDPASPERILAATPSGLMRSRDGGRSFTPISATPAMQALAWVDTGVLYGLAGNGDLWASSDGGDTWTWRNRVAGTPEALTAADDYLHIATTEAISTSTDGGRSFTTRYRLA